MANTEVKIAIGEIQSKLICASAKRILWNGGEPVSTQAVADYHHRLKQAGQIFASVSFPNREKVARKLASTLAPHLPPRLNDRIEVLALSDLVRTFQAGAEPLLSLNGKLRQIVKDSHTIASDPALIQFKNLINYETKPLVFGKIQAFIKKKLSPQPSFGQRMKSLRELREVAKRPEFRNQCMHAIVEAIHRRDVPLSEIAMIARTPSGSSLFTEPAVSTAIITEVDTLLRGLKKSPPSKSTAALNTERLEHIEFLGALTQFLTVHQEEYLIHLKNITAPELMQLVTKGIEQHQPLLLIESLLDFINSREVVVTQNMYPTAASYVLHHLTMNPLEVFSLLRRSLSIFDLPTINTLINDQHIQSKAAEILLRYTTEYFNCAKETLTVSSLEESKGTLTRLVELHSATMTISSIIFGAPRSVFLPRGDTAFVSSIFGDSESTTPQLILVDEEVERFGLFEVLPFNISKKAQNSLKLAVKERLDESIRMAGYFQFPVGEIGVASTDLQMTDALSKIHKALHRWHSASENSKKRCAREIAELFLSVDVSEVVYHASPLALAEAGLAYEHGRRAPAEELNEKN